ncbi:uncharacterized protein LOC134440858 isoform X2 [Engraulis encrasicolus]|uniref:uncharacterized protein LOC134440858 isoform X2 n=1 Tax=Engraulis encrasicolus TaxID=184585 RepID=UPI002FD2D386
MKPSSVLFSVSWWDKAIVLENKTTCVRASKTGRDESTRYCSLPDVKFWVECIRPNLTDSLLPQLSPNYVTTSLTWSTSALTVRPLSDKCPGTKSVQGTKAVQSERKTQEDTPVSMDTLEPVKSPVTVKEESTADLHSRSQSQSQSRSRSPSLSRSPNPSRDIGDTTNQSCSRQTPQSELHQGSSEMRGGDGGGNGEPKRGRDDRESTEERTIGDGGGSSDAWRGRDGRESGGESRGGNDRRCRWNRDHRKEKHEGQSSGSSSVSSSRKRHSNESVTSVTAEMASKRAKTVSSPTAKMSTRRDGTSLSSPTAKLSTERAKTSLSGQRSPVPEVTNDDEDLARKEMELRELTASLNRLKAMLAMCTPPTSPGTNDINDTDVTPQPLLGKMENAVELSPSETLVLVNKNGSSSLSRVDDKDVGTQKVNADDLDGDRLDTGICLDQQRHREAEVTEDSACLLGQEPDDTQQADSEQNTWSGQEQSAAQTHRQLNKDEQFCQDKTLFQSRTAALSEESHRGQELYDPFHVDEEDENKLMEETTKRQLAFDTSNISIYRSPAAETKEDEEQLMMKARELERLNALIAEGKAMLAMETQGKPPDCECPTQADKTPEISTKCQPQAFLPAPQQRPSTLDNHRTIVLSEKHSGADLYDPFEVDEVNENAIMEGSIKGLTHESQQQEEKDEGVGIGMVSPMESQLLSRAKGVGIGGMGIVSHREDRSFSQSEVGDEETYLYGEKHGDCHPACSKYLKSSDQCEKTEQTHNPEKSDVPKLTFGELETIFLSMGFSFPQSSTVNQLGSKADEAIKPHGTTPSLFSSHKEHKEHNRSKDHEMSMDKHHWANEAIPKAVSLQHPQGPVTNSVETVWICGDGLVDLASRLANSPTYGMKLGQSIAGVRLYWKGELSMKWARLVPRLLQLARDWPIPDMLIIHLGDDDIILRDTQELLCAMERDLSFIHNLFPHCLIVWSDLLPNKISKQGSSALVVQDGIHDLVNRRMHALIAALGGMALTHELLIPELYRHHGTRFSRLVVEKLFLNIKQFVGRWSLEVHRASEMCSPECHPPRCASSFTCSIPDDSIHPKSTNSHSKCKERPPSHLPSLPKKQQVTEGQVKPKEVRLSTETAKRSTGVMEAKQCMEQRTRPSEVVKPCPVPDESSASTHLKSPNSHTKPKEKSCSILVLKKQQVTEAKVMKQDTEEVKCTTDNAKQPTEDTMVASQSTEMLNQPMGSKRSTDVVNQPMVASRSTQVVNRPMGAKRSAEVMCSSEEAKRSRFTSTIPDDSSAASCPKATNGPPNPKGKPSSTALPTEQQQVGEEMLHMAKQSRKEAKCSTEDRKWPTEKAKRSRKKRKRFTEVARPSTEEPKQSMEDAKWSREEAKQPTEARKAASAGAGAVLAEKRAALEAQKAALEAKLAKLAVSPTLLHTEHTTDQQIKRKVKLTTKAKAKKVWIIGDSQVLKSVQKHIVMRQNEKGHTWRPYWIPLVDVSLAKVVHQVLKVQSENWPNPDMLIIHLGSSCDIPHRNLEQMVLSIQEHLLMIRRIFPQCALVWSDILSRTHRKTQGHEDAHSTDLASNRHEVNMRLCSIVKQLGGAVIAHGNIQPEHFVSEGSLLSDKGEQLFKQNILGFVDPWKWDHNSIPILSEHLPESTRPADHKEALAHLTDRTDQPITGYGTQKAAQVVWICGKHFCGLARDSAEQLGIPLRSGTGSLEVVWKAIWGKTTFSFKNLVSLEDKVIRQPNMVIFYLDDVEVGGDWKSVLTDIKREMELLHTVFPACLIVWSDIFKGIALNVTGPGLDLINTIMHIVVTELGGRVVTHDNIKPELFQIQNSTFISKRVTQQANRNIQEFVLKWETEVRGLAQNTKPSPQ